MADYPTGEKMKSRVAAFMVRLGIGWVGILVPFLVLNSSPEFRIFKHVEALGLPSDMPVVL